MTHWAFMPVVFVLEVVQFVREFGDFRREEHDLRPVFAVRLAPCAELVVVLPLFPAIVVVGTASTHVES